MKKYLSLLIALALTLCFAACGGTSASTGTSEVEGAVSDLLTQVTDGATDPELSLATTEVNEDNFSWYFFIDPIEGAEAVVSEPIIGSIAHCVGLLRVPEGTDAEQVRTEIEEKLDPRKWVCTEAEKTAVLRRGNLILMVMSEADTVDKVTANFNALGK